MSWVCVVPEATFKLGWAATTPHIPKKRESPAARTRVGSVLKSFMSMEVGLSRLTSPAQKRLHEVGKFSAHQGPDGHPHAAQSDAGEQAWFDFLHDRLSVGPTPNCPTQQWATQGIHAVKCAFPPTPSSVQCARPRWSSPNAGHRQSVQRPSISRAYT